MMKMFLSARWENLIMANYAIDPEVLKPYLPKGVEIDMYHNKAYVSLVGFMFKNTTHFQIPTPLLGTFEEINLRFYVKRTEGSLEEFSFLNEQTADSVIFAEGSAVTIDWKRTKI